MQPHAAVADVPVAGGQLRRRQLQGHGVDVQPFDGVLDRQPLQGGDVGVVGAPFPGAPFHVGEHRRQQGAAAAGRVDGLVFAPGLRRGPIDIAAGVEGEAGGDDRRRGAGEIGAVGRLVAHDSVEQGAGVVGAHVGVGLGDALRFRGEVAQGAFQPRQFAGVLDGFHGGDGGFQHRAEVVEHDALPLPPDADDHVHLVLDRLQVADAGDPFAVGDALVQHGGVHQEQRGDGAAVGLPRALVVLQIVQPEVPVQGRPQVVVPHMAGGFLDAAFQDVQVSDHAVLDQAGLGEQVHPDGVAVVFQSAQQQHLQRVALPPLLRFPFGGGVDANARPLVDHVPRLVFGFSVVHGAGRPVGGGFGPGNGVQADFNAAVVGPLAGDDLRRPAGIVLRGCGFRHA